VMRTRGIVSAAREGTTVRYSVTDPEVFALLDTARSVFEKRLNAQRQALSAATAE
jgi:hypothetical protein